MAHSMTLSPTAASRPGPHFLGIGAQKAGTTWLWTQLKQHSQVWMPHHKEIHYFSRDVMAPGGGILAESSILRRLTGSARAHALWRGIANADLRQSIYARDWDKLKWSLKFHFQSPSDRWYESLFAGRGTLLTGEISPSYSMLTDDEVAHIAKRWPYLKILLLLRNPIDRAWSQVRFDWTRGMRAEVRDLEEMKAFIDSPAQELRSDYLRILDRWGRHFPREQFFLGFYDEVAQQPAALLERVQTFLGIEAQPVRAESLRQRVNISKEVGMPPGIRVYLTQKYLSEIAALSERVGGPVKEWLAQASSPEVTAS